jgi:2-polyprenyl-3-methyl-5-hydroxy-6-metoxy-1,4-benzoquinol methylase
MTNSAIESIDFNMLYGLQKQASTHRKKDCDAWDKKASQMNQNIHSGDYNEVIQEWVLTTPEDTLLDVGCGPGTFALRLAPKVREVYGFDFSTKMLEICSENAKTKGLNNIKLFQSDIEGDWQDVPICDVVLASRCLEVDNLRQTLVQLNAHAKRAVYLTFKVGKSYLKDELLEAMGRQIIPKPDYIYLINILYQMGINASISFYNPKESCCENVCLEDEYIQSISWSLDGISKEEEQRARNLYQMSLKEGKAPPLRDSRWALIWWNKEG